jgi:type I restriction enzyme M protein
MDTAQNQGEIGTFMAKYVTKPFEYLDNTVGVEINFNKVFYKPENPGNISVILEEIDKLENELQSLEQSLGL